MYNVELYGRDNMYAKVVADSVYEDGPRLITIETLAPKFLDAQIEKHRMISSNSSSDRAVPFSKLKEREIYLPSDVRLNQRGMQGDRKMKPYEYGQFRRSLNKIYQYTIEELEAYDHVHKQHLNRYLLGFTLQTKVMTATENEWEYFLNLRLSEHADPAIQGLAVLIKEVIRKSTPHELTENSAHAPYIDLETLQRVVDWCGRPKNYDVNNKPFYPSEIVKKISVARCARCSYLNHDKTTTNIDKDIALHDMLEREWHCTPFEHVAFPMTKNMDLKSPGVSHMTKSGELYSGNFRGWIQLRKLMEEKYEQR